MEPIRTAKKHTLQAVDSLGRWLQLDIYYFLRGGFWLSSAHLLNAVMAFLLIIAFTRLTSKDFFGQYKFVLAVIGLVSIFSLPGMRIAISQSVSRGRDASLIQATKISFISSLLGSVALTVIALYLKFFRHNEIWYVFLAAAALFPFVYSFKGYEFFFLGKKKFKLMALSNMLSQFLAITGVLITVLLGSSLLLIIIIYFATISLVNICFYRYVTRKRLRGKDPDITHYGLHLSFMGGVHILGLHIDKLIIPFFLGFEQLAIYAVAASIPEGIKGLVGLSSRMFLPKFSSFKGSGIYKKLKSKLFLVLVISLGISVVGILLSPFFVPLLFSKTYTSAVPFAQVLFISIAFALPTSIFLPLLQARKKVKRLYSYHITFTIVSVLALLALLPKYGLMGACVARIIVRYVQAGQLWWSARSC